MLRAAQLAGITRSVRASLKITGRMIRSVLNFNFSKYDNEHFEDGVFEASDERIQRARSLHRAWKNRKWPEPVKVRKLTNRKIPCAIQMEPNQSRFQNTVKSLEKENFISATRCWAIFRNNPLQATPIRQRFRAAENS